MNVDDVGSQNDAIINQQTKSRVREFNNVADFVHYASIEF
jgi:hypothetical protein